MGSAYQVHVVFLQEARDDVRAKRERDATVVLRPADDVLIRVRPEEITEQACRQIAKMSRRKEDVCVHTGLGDVGRSHHASDLFHGLQVRAEPAVHREDLLVDDGGDREAVEAVRERLPELDIVPAFACEGRNSISPRAHESESATSERGAGHIHSS